LVECFEKEIVLLHCAAKEIDQSHPNYRYFISA